MRAGVRIELLRVEHAFLDPQKRVARGRQNGERARRGLHAF